MEDTLVYSFGFYYIEKIVILQYLEFKIRGKLHQKRILRFKLFRYFWSVGITELLRMVFVGICSGIVTLGISAELVGIEFPVISVGDISVD